MALSITTCRGIQRGLHLQRHLCLRTQGNEDCDERGNGVLKSFVTRVWEGWMVEVNKLQPYNKWVFHIFSYVPYMHTIIYSFASCVYLVHVGCFQSLFAIVGFAFVLSLIRCQLFGALGGSNQSMILLAILPQWCTPKATTQLVHIMHMQNIYFHYVWWTSCFEPKFHVTCILYILVMEFQWRVHSSIPI